MSRKRSGPRDTAKDIILGLDPSGESPRQPREGIAKITDANCFSRKKAPVNAVQPTLIKQTDSNVLQNLQNQLSLLQQQYNELLRKEMEARKILEANQNALNQKLSSIDINDLMKEIEGLRRGITMNDGKANRNVDNKLNDLCQQINDIKRMITDEIDERSKMIQLQKDDIIQKILCEEEFKNFEKQNFERKIKQGLEKMNEEIQLLRDAKNIKSGVNQNINDESELNRKIMKNSSDVQEWCKRQINEFKEELARKLAKDLDKKLEILSNELRNMSEDHEREKAECRNKLNGINEALANLESQIEDGDNKINKLTLTSSQSRKNDENRLLMKIDEIEELINHYTNDLKKVIGDIHNGKQNIKFPSFDFDILRNEMDSIAADRNKMSMAGLLKLEEKISELQNGFHRDKLELQHQFEILAINMDGMEGITNHLHKLQSIHNEMNKAQQMLRDRVEKQIPHDLNELSAKTDNVKHQLNTRIDREEEERLFAIKKLQEKIETDLGLQKTENKIGIDENMKIAVRKLAESVVTAKDFLNNKITVEVQQVCV
ncbi:unnamed protein product [Dracunculus medinensis]|uniref:Uncharacterized protein n=1 Tax=Dracunculus medinensis TaxID=318479 RepID=A0A158Q314_DRAME|nr:unnamed protein product [Dracunculus medinensis]